MLPDATQRPVFRALVIWIACAAVFSILVLTPIGEVAVFAIPAMAIIWPVTVARAHAQLQRRRRYIAVGSPGSYAVAAAGIVAMPFVGMMNGAILGNISGYFPDHLWNAAIGIGICCAPVGMVIHAVAATSLSGFARRNPWKCTKCGYSLRGSPQSVTCPECGHELKRGVDLPADPETLDRSIEAMRAMTTKEPEDGNENGNADEDEGPKSADASPSD